MRTLNISVCGAISVEEPNEMTAAWRSVSLFDLSFLLYYGTRNYTYLKINTATKIFPIAR